MFYSLSLSTSTSSTCFPGRRNSDQTPAVAKTDAERWNPAPSGQCQCVYPGGSTSHITQASSALLMLKNRSVQQLPAFERLLMLKEKNGQHQNLWLPQEFEI